MKALYSNKIECIKKTKKNNSLKTYNYESRYQALKEGFKFVHLFETSLSESNEKIYSHYSTMKL